MEDLTKERFDSILVRLKATLPPMIQTINIVFRFHTGSIKREFMKNQRIDELGFDSILVRLKGKRAPD